MDTYTRTYLVDPPASAWQAMQGRFSCRSGRRERLRQTYYDTFDWRLHRVGATLCVVPEGRRYRLVWRPAGGRRGSFVISEAVPGFVWDLPPGLVRDALAPLVEMRRLQPVVQVDLRRAALRVLDHQEKTIVRLAQETGTAAGPTADMPRHAMAPVLHVIPVKGYDEALAEVVTFAESELGLRPVPGGELERGLAAIGQRPDDPARAESPVAPHGRADAAVRQILAELLETVRSNEPGVRQDIDTEFLHDLRVAARRGRAILGQMKQVLPATAAATLRGELSWLGQATGPTRDLDVHLLKMPGYAASLPAHLAADLAPLGEFLRARRSQERAALIAALDSPRYQALLVAWQALADPSPPADTALANAGRPIVVVASEHAWRAYRRVRRRERDLGATPKATALHRLRIDCKKLRYLMQFFHDLYPREEIGSVIQALKRLQDNLGEINDLQVQRARLQEMAGQMVAEQRASAATLMAMGRLVDHLELRQVAARRRLSRGLDGFTTAENRARFRRLFQAGGRAIA